MNTHRAKVQSTFPGRSTSLGWRRRLTLHNLSIEHHLPLLIGAFETTNEGVWIFDKNLRTTYVNERLAEMLRVSLKEMGGRSAIEFLDAEARLEVERRWQRRAPGVKEQYDLR